MGEDWKSHISKSFNDAVRDYRGWDGKNEDPTELINQKVDLLSSIKTESQSLDEETVDYLDYLKNKKDIIKISELIKNKKISNNKIKTEIKKYLKDPEDLKKFLNSILEKRFSKKETKETTGAVSAGGYEAPLFSNETKKIEATEATSTASSGQYTTNKVWAKSLSKKDWRGKSRTQIPGGKFVQVKKKCKRFPYCNQGDIKALNIFENETLKNTIKNISDRYGIHEDIIKDIIITEMNKSS